MCANKTTLVSLFNIDHLHIAHNYCTNNEDRVNVKLPDPS